MFTNKAIQVAFEAIYPELSSRVAVMARRFPDREEATGEMLAFAWANYKSVARRRGVFLHPGHLVWASSLRLRSGRFLTGSSVRDVHAAMAQIQGRVRIVHLSVLSCSKRQQCLPDSTVQHITEALTTSENARPDVRAATRLDWAEFLRRLPVRLQKIIQWLAIGASKTWIARRLGISNARVTQLLAVLAQEIRSYFGADVVQA